MISSLRLFLNKKNTPDLVPMLSISRRQLWSSDLHQPGLTNLSKIIIYFSTIKMILVNPIIHVILGLKNPINPI